MACIALKIIKKAPTIHHTPYTINHKPLSLQRLRVANLSMARYIPMATGNFLLGYGRRSIGDVTFYRSGGQQRARARNRQPANPRSEKQSIQRMILATAAKMAAAYTPIVNHSWEGIAVGQPSVQHFRSLAMQTLRTSAAAAINRETNIPLGQFAIKGAPIVGSTEGIRISSGSLGVNGVTIAGEDIVRYTIGSALADSITTQEQYVAELKKLSLLPGDQMTFVVQTIDPVTIVASYVLDGSTVVNFAETVKFCRVVFKSELPEGFSGAIYDSATGWFKAALIEEQQGEHPMIDEHTADHIDFTFETVLEGTQVIEMAGVIRSQKQLDGKFKYSNSYMKMGSNIDANIAPDVFPSYMNGVGVINVGDVLYLQRAVASPFETGE